MNLNFSHQEGWSRSSTRAFTMIEIAIALAVIAFALVAIIGVLPTGLTVQKDNREDTIINQDGPYWMEAIRTGAKGLDQLTNYVDQIGVVLIPLGDTNLNNAITDTNFYNLAANKTGSNIVALLSSPKGSLNINGGTTQVVIRVEAHVRALTGSAVEQAGASKDLAFSYLLTTEIVPFQFFANDSTNWVQHSNDYVAYINTPSPTANGKASLLNRWIASSNRFEEVPNLRANTHELRLNFQWPLLAGGKIGPNRQLFRSVAAGQVLRIGNQQHFFQPQLYAKP